jgi:hypothetical protein
MLTMGQDVSNIVFGNTLSDDSLPEGFSTWAAA